MNLAKITNVIKTFPSMSKPALLSFKVPESYEELVSFFAKKERRSNSAVARSIWERGLASLARDGSIMEDMVPDAEALLGTLKKELADPEKSAKKETGKKKRSGTLG